MRRTARARFLGSLSVVVGTLCLPAVARSEPASDEPRALLSQNAAAVEAGRAALDAYQRRDWAEAFEQFHAAEALAHSPVFLLFMARTKERQGELLAALDLYARVLAEPTVSEMPDAWLRAIEAAGVERLAVLARVPSLIIVLARNHPPGTIVMVDDVPFERAETELLLNPGAH
ncbi:MAG TPA: hypothetical protein VFQ35_05720, partial [Polyangiaceae bacterium]|nr:hypothetical protein [Polyangiaceae bacterium]